MPSDRKQAIRDYMFSPLFNTTKFTRQKNSKSTDNYLLTRKGKISESEINKPNFLISKSILQFGFKMKWLFREHILHTCCIEISQHTRQYIIRMF